MTFDQHDHSRFHKGTVPTAQLAAGVAHTHVRGEQFTGNAVLTAFTLAHTPLSGVDAFVGGVRVDPLSVVGAVVTFVAAPALAATIRISYEYQSP